MEIYRQVMGQIGDLSALSQQEMDKISLCVVSKKNPYLKKLNLKGLNAQQRLQKLAQWGHDKRLVAVIEIGDKIVALGHATFMEKLERQKGLTVEGKKISLHRLTEEEAEKLFLIAQLYEEYFLEANDKFSEENLDHHQTHPRPHLPSRASVVSNQPLSHEKDVEYAIAHVKHTLGKVVLECLKRLNDVYREERKQKEADAKKRRILEKELEKERRRGEIKAEIIRQQHKQQNSILEDLAHLHFLRSFFTLSH